MMKALKSCRNSRDKERAFALLDRSKLNVCEDEVLLNTVLDTCIRQREHGRLEQVLKALSESTVRPSQHTYGSLIKAYSSLKQPQKCWHLWNEMSERLIEPTDVVVGCMMD